MSNLRATFHLTETECRKGRIWPWLNISNEITCCFIDMVKTQIPDDPAQSKRFIDAAREAEADESEEAADQAFKKVAAKVRTPKGR